MTSFSSSSSSSSSSPRAVFERVVKRLLTATFDSNFFFYLLFSFSDFTTLSSRFTFTPSGGKTLEKVRTSTHAHGSSFLSLAERTRGRGVPSRDKRFKRKTERERESHFLRESQGGLDLEKREKEVRSGSRAKQARKNGQKRRASPVDQHEENQTRESDSVHGGNDGADDGVEKTQLRHEQVFERVGVAG